MGLKEYNEKMNEKLKGTERGSRFFREHTERIDRIKSLPKRTVKRIFRYVKDVRRKTINKIDRAMNKVIPKKVIEIKNPKPKKISRFK